MKKVLPVPQVSSCGDSFSTMNSSCHVDDRRRHSLRTEYRFGGLSKRRFGSRWSMDRPKQEQIDLIHEPFGREIVP